MYAKAGNNAEGVARLICAGADPGVKAAAGLTPFMAPGIENAGMQNVDDLGLAWRRHLHLQFSFGFSQYSNFGERLRISWCKTDLSSKVSMFFGCPCRHQRSNLKDSESGSLDHALGIRF